MLLLGVVAVLVVLVAVLEGKQIIEPDVKLRTNGHKHGYSCCCHIAVSYKGRSSQGSCRAISLMRDTHPIIRALGISHTACKYEFRRNLRSHTSSVFLFFIIRIE